MSQLRSQFVDRAAPGPSSSIAGQSSRIDRSSGMPTISPHNQQFRRQGSISSTAARRSSDTPSAFSKRPSTAPGNKQKRATFISGGGSDDEDDDLPSPKQLPSKPPFLRSKSDHGLRPEEPDPSDDELDQEPVAEWGARHGFEDHYQSEDIISQLANVSVSLLTLPCLLLPERAQYIHFYAEN